MIADRVTQDVVGKASRPEVVADSFFFFFFCLSLLFGDKLAAALTQPVFGKTNTRRSRKIATVSTASFTTSQRKTNRSRRGERYEEIDACREKKKTLCYYV